MNAINIVSGSKLIYIHCFYYDLHCICYCPQLTSAYVELLNPFALEFPNDFSYVHESIHIVAYLLYFDAVSSYINYFQVRVKSIDFFFQLVSDK